MESEKIESINFSIWDFIYIRNGRSRRGLQTRHWQNFGSYGKRRIFGPKTEFLGPKKHPLLGSNHVLATTGKNCANKEVRFFPNKYHFLADFVFFGKKRIFGQKNAFQPIVKMTVSPYFRPGPGLLSSCWRKSQFQNKKLTFGPNYPNLWVKIKLFRP